MKSTIKKLSILLCATVPALLAIPCLAGNPIVNEAFPDVNIEIVGDTAYAFGGTDIRPYDMEVKYFVMPYWKLYASTDLVNWTLQSVLRPAETSIGETDKCFAGHGVQRNGKWYWYLSNFVKSTHVAISDSPAGPWHDPLGKPLLPADISPTREYDPIVFNDDDGRAYIIFGSRIGNKLGYHIAELNDDMISLKTQPKRLKIKGAPAEWEAEAVDAPFVHKYNGRYYLSWRQPYAMADNIMGPYHFVGRHDAPGHGGFFEFNQQTFVNFTSLKSDMRRRYRFSSFAYVHYRDDGSIGPISDLIKMYGVGEYEAGWKKIEAEWYMGISGAVKSENAAGGFEISGISNNDSLSFPNIHYVPDDATITFNASANGPGTIEIHKDSAAGELLGRVAVESTGNWRKYKTFTGQLENPYGRHSLVFVFKSKQGDADFLHLDWFSIE